MGNWARPGKHPNKFGTPYLFLQPLKASELGLESSLPSNNFYDQKWRGSGLGEHSKNGTPYLFLQPLKLASSNLVHNLGSSSSLPRNIFTTKIGGGPGYEASQKSWDPLFISATV